jgi:hypothetical protein
MRTHKDAIQLMALYLWRCINRGILGILRKAIYFKRITRTFTCPTIVRVDDAPPFVNPPKRVRNKESGYQNVYEGGWDIELLGVVGNALNLSLDFHAGKEKEYLKAFQLSTPGVVIFPSIKFGLMKSTRSYISENLVWYTPCNLKYQKRSRFFHIFSAKLWISFALTLVLSVISQLHFQLQIQTALARIQTTLPRGDSPCAVAAGETTRRTTGAASCGRKRSPHLQNRRPIVAVRAPPQPILPLWWNSGPGSLPSRWSWAKGGITQSEGACYQGYHTTPYSKSPFPAHHESSRAT